MEDSLQGSSKEKAIRYLGMTNIPHGLFMLFIPVSNGQVSTFPNFNNCYSNASSWAELGIQPKTRKAGEKLHFYCQRASPEAQGWFGAAEQVVLCTPADSHPLQDTQPGTQQTPQPLLRNNDHWTTRLSSMLQPFFMVPIPNKGSWDCLRLTALDPACFLHIKVWAILTSNAKRSLMDIYHTNLLLCTMSVGKRRKCKVPKTFSM